MAPWCCGDLDTTEDAFLTLQTTAFELSNGWHAEFTETPEWNNVKALISCHSRAGRDEDGGIKLGSVTIMCLKIEMVQL